MLGPLGIFGQNSGGVKPEAPGYGVFSLVEAAAGPALQRLQFVPALHARRLRHRPQVRLGHRADRASAAAGNLPLDLVQPQNALRQVVGCGTEGSRAKRSTSYVQRIRNES